MDTFGGPRKVIPEGELEKIKKAKALVKKGEVLIDGKKYYSAPKFSELSGVHHATICRYIGKKKIKFVEVGRRRFISEGELEKVKKAKGLEKEGEVLIDGQKYYSVRKLSEIGGVSQTIIRLYVKEKKIKYTLFDTFEGPRKVIPEGELEKVKKAKGLKKEEEVLIDGEKHYSVKKFSALVGLSIATIWKRIGDNRTKSVKVGGSRLVPESEVAKIS